MKTFTTEGCGINDQPKEAGTLCTDKVAWQMITERDKKIAEQAAEIERLKEAIGSGLSERDMFINDCIGVREL